MACTEAIMLAHGFKTEMLVELVNAGLASVTTERVVAGGLKMEVAQCGSLTPGGGHSRNGKTACAKKQGQSGMRKEVDRRLLVRPDCLMFFCDDTGHEDFRDPKFPL